MTSDLKLYTSHFPSETSIIAHWDLEELLKDFYLIYQFLQKINRTVFDSNEKILLYGAGKPCYDTLVHIQNALTTFDISNFFVHIVCPYDLSTDLLSISQTLEIDVPINSHIINHPCPIGEYPRVVVPDSICPRPWKSIEIRANGNLSPCCVYQASVKDSNGQVININTHSIEDYFHSDHMRALRKNLRSGIKDRGCDFCWNKEKQNSPSIRKWGLYHLSKEFLSSDPRQEDLSQVVYLDMDFGNLCNLKCVTCNWQRSSTIGAELLKNLDDDTQALKQKIQIYNHQSKWIENPDIWEKFEKILPNLRFAEFEGGEPFFHDYHSWLLERFIQRNLARNIRLRYNTNGTIFPDFWLDQWRYFKEVHVIFSIDDINDRFEYQRTNAIWSEVKRNLDDYFNLTLPNLTHTFQCTVNLQNILYLPELICELESYDCPIHFLVLEAPEGLNIKNLTSTAKELILDKYKEFAKIKPHLWSKLEPVYQTVQQVIPQDGKIFREFISKNDQKRQHDYSLAHKEMAQAMGYSH